MVYYRKYRPQTIEELDSAKLRETLTSVLSSASVPHAFLLTGPKGLGKTSTARIIAKVVNCEHRKKGSIEPDNTCEQCVSITNGSNLDVLEIDGASNRGIDEIRDLRDKVKLAPARAKMKIYIIDEVHMLTTEAFNALLKTIEEPPAYVMFIFCTTEPQKVPDTILSRCFHIAYPKATNADIVRSLARVVKAEKLSIDKEVLEEIAKMADGGFRDATKILEELVLVAGDKKIDKGFIDSYYKTTNIQVLLTTFLAYLGKHDITGSLHIVQQLVDQGVDLKWFLSQVLTRLNEILLAQLGVQGEITSFPENIRFETVTIQRLVTIFSEAYQQTKYAVVSQLPLELAVVDWCSNKNDQLPEMKQASLDKHPLDPLIKKEKNLKVQSILRGSKEEPEKKEETTGLSQEELTDKSVPEQFMENLIYKIKPINFSVAGVLRGCSVKKMADGKVMLITNYKFHKEKLSEPKTLTVIEKAVKEITGKELQVVVELKQ